MPDDSAHPINHPAAAEQAAGWEDRIVAALAYLRRGLSRDGRPLGESSFASQEACLAECAESLGLLLNPDDLPSKAVKGGQEHDLWHDETTDRYWKLTPPVAGASRSRPSPEHPAPDFQMASHTSIHIPWCRALRDRFTARFEVVRKLNDRNNPDVPFRYLAGDDIKPVIILSDSFTQST